MIPRATYQPGDAAREAEMFPSNRAGMSAVGEIDPGLAWCESVREIDPDGEIALALSREIRKEGGGP